MLLLLLLLLWVPVLLPVRVAERPRPALLLMKMAVELATRVDELVVAEVVAARVLLLRQQVLRMPVRLTSLLGVVQGDLVAVLHLRHHLGMLRTERGELALVPALLRCQL